MKKIKKILAANRSEIAIRIFRAAEESNIKTVAIYSREDRFALHRFKTDESYLIGKNKGPIQAYLDIDSIIKIAKKAKVDAIHPGYGFLSESPEFAMACYKNKINFIGPDASLLKKLGNKIEAKKIARQIKIKVIPELIPNKIDNKNLKLQVRKIGYPVIIKANWGGGGRGMRVVKNEKELNDKMTLAKNEAKKSFGKEEIFIEKYIKNAAHIEVQILGDNFGNIVHLFERDCSLQRRHQKIVERAPAEFLNDKDRKKVCNLAVKLAKKVKYKGAGTVEFLYDNKSKEFYFIEINPRIQVEHTVSEEVTGIDIVKAQINIAEGKKIGKDKSLPSQKEIKLNGFAIQCRITTEDPKNNFMPDYGKITTYRSASGFGIRLDAGTAAAGSVVTPYYDSLLVKITSWANNSQECIKRMDRALREFRIRGVKTNLVFLESLINHKNFKQSKYNTNFVDNEKGLYNFKQKKDRASKIISYLGNIIVNGNDEVKERLEPINLIDPIIPKVDKKTKKENYVSLLNKKGPKNFAKWVKAKENIFITDTTMRDAHQSLLATRIRTKDLTNISEFYSNNLSQLFSIECWGGATFDVSMRFLKEDPWERINKIKSKAPNLLAQMLFRGSNAVGYKNYPDDVVKFFVKQSAKAGIDVFRIFDALNLTENMKVAIESVNKEEKLCEGTICYTNDLSDPKEKKYTLKYYLEIAKKLEKIGAHIIAIKDMAGICKPEAAEILIKGLKDTTDLPIHFHTHDTSGTSSASVISAIKSGVDIVDLAMDSMSSLTSQPPMGSIVNSMNNSSRKPEIDEESIRHASIYWEEVRQNYKAFESEFKGGSSDVYIHQMPGGQFTNLKEQARSMGIGLSKWDLVAKKYSEVNKMFGDIIKVTPTSKVVGDMALYMVTNDLDSKDIINEKKEISFPKSVIEFFRGELGIPKDGFPRKLQKKILKNIKPLKKRPGAALPNTNFKKIKNYLKKELNKEVNDYGVASYLMYPDVFLDFCDYSKIYGDTSILPTPLFFYGPKIEKEYALPIDQGKSLILRYLAKGQTNNEGNCAVFFEINGQPRTVEIADKNKESNVLKRKKADSGNTNQVGSPLPGQISEVLVNKGEKIIKGDKLIVIEAMKMETVINAEISGTIEKIEVKKGDNVETKDLLVEII